MVLILSYLMAKLEHCFYLQLLAKKSNRRLTNIIDLQKLPYFRNLNFDTVFDKHVSISCYQYIVCLSVTALVLVCYPLSLLMNNKQCYVHKVQLTIA